MNLSEHYIFQASPKMSLLLFGTQPVQDATRNKHSEENAPGRGMPPCYTMEYLKKLMDLVISHDLQNKYGY